MSIYHRSRHRTKPRGRRRATRRRIRCAVLLTTLVLQWLSLRAQRMVAITIDDVPNVKCTLEQHGRSRLLEILDSASVPATIFINEQKVDKIIAAGGDSTILERWIKNKWITVGNHSYAHSRSSAVGVDSFMVDVDKGALRTTALARRYSKSLSFFRFPYNDCGKDSLQQDSLYRSLAHRQYRIAPFSVESSDYMFNLVYESRLDSSRYQDARAVGLAYVRYTSGLFRYIDSVAVQQGATGLAHIFLCHDSHLNRDYMPLILKELRAMGYTFITLDAACRDHNYQRPLGYKGRAGISWVYRWIADSNERRRLMRAEPDISEIEREYELRQKQR